MALTRTINWRAWRTTRPGRLIRWKRTAFIRLVSQADPRTSRFIAALRLWARIMIAHQAALAPNSPDGIRPPARSPFMTEWASSLLPQRSRSHQITASPGQGAVGHHGEQLVAPLGGKLFGGKRQLVGVAQVQLPQRFTDHQEAVIC